MSVKVFQLFFWIGVGGLCELQSSFILNFFTLQSPLCTPVSVSAVSGKT